MKISFPIDSHISWTPIQCSTFMMKNYHGDVVEYKWRKMMKTSPSIAEYCLL